MKTQSPSFAAMPDDQFRQMVDEDLRGRSTDEVRRALRLPENVDRWYSVLLQMSKSVEGQLAAKKSDWSTTRSRLQLQISTTRDVAKSNAFKVRLQEERTKYNSWRAGTIRFKTGLDEFLADARRLRDSARDTGYDSAMSNERIRLSQRVALLEDGIRRHRDAIVSDPEDDDAHEDADEELWKLIS